MAGDDEYVGREQALIKHEVLRHYLQHLAFKVGGFRPGTTLNYIDGFSGPWDAVQDDHGDSSPAIAMRELAKARDALASLPTPKPMEVRCMFVEKDKTAFGRLQTLCASAPVQATGVRGEFEAHIDDAVAFAREGSKPFAFVFIDPKGWTGFALQTIAPLLRVHPSEVLINFMLHHIARFIDDDASVATESFRKLFGELSDEYCAGWKTLTKLDREDAIVDAYCHRVRKAGGFRYCVSTVVLKPTSDRTHYHLVFATRSRKGLITFRAIERKMIPQQRDVRARAKQRRTEAKRGQIALLAPTDMHPDHMGYRAQRYRDRARERVEAALLSHRRAILYDDLVDIALQWPLTSEAELKAWLEEWVREGRIEYVGLGEQERKPKVDRGHHVRCIA